MSSDELPQELINSIIGLVGDTETLNSTSLVARPFRPAAQAQLFSQITLEKPTQPPRLLEILHTSPSIANFIQSLTICYDCLPGLFVDDDGEKARRANDCLASILSLLPNISALRLPGVSSYTSTKLGRDWIDLSPSFITALETIFSREALTHVSMAEFYNVPLSIFQHFKRLQSLELSAVSPELSSETTLPERTIHTDMLHLELRIQSGKGETRNSYPALYPKGLLRGTLSPSAASVQHLYAKFYAWIQDDIIAECNLQPMSNLKSLHISFGFPALGALIQLARFSRIIETVDASSPLEDVTLDLGLISIHAFNWDIYPNLIQACFEDPRWAECNALLAKIKKLARFHVKMNAAVTAEENTPENQALLEASLTGAFPDMAQLGKLDVEGTLSVETD